MRRMTFVALAGVILGAASARASDPVGIYALIDKVVLQPKEGTPERIQISGVFVLARNNGREHTAPVRGYMYFTTTQGQEDVCRREWADLQKVAGTGEVVTFGNSRAPTGVIRKPVRVPKKETAAPLDAAKLQALIADLDKDDFAVREKATRELERQGAHAQAELR